MQWYMSLIYLKRRLTIFHVYPQKKSQVPKQTLTRVFVVVIVPPVHTGHITYIDSMFERDVSSKSISMFIWAPDCCFKTRLEKLWTYPLMNIHFFCSYKNKHTVNISCDVFFSRQLWYDMQIIVTDWLLNFGVKSMV